MKIKKAYAQMSKSKHLKLLGNEYTRDDDELVSGDQWLTDGFIAYRLEGMPVFDENNILSLLGISAEQSEKYSVSKSCIRDQINGTVKRMFMDSLTTDIYITPLFEIFDVTVMADEGRTQVLFVPTNFVDVFDGSDTSFVLRTDDDGRRIVAAREGLILKGIAYSNDYLTVEAAEKHISNLMLVVREIERQKAKM